MSMDARSSCSTRSTPPARRGRRAAARGARRRAAASCSCPATSRAETWAPEWRAMLPATIGPVVDRTRGRRRNACRRSTTRSRCSSCSTRREAATSRRRAFIGIARSRRRRARRVVGALRRRIAGARRAGGGQRQASSCGRRRSIRTGRTCRCSRCSCRSCTNSASTSAATPIRGRGSSTGEVLDLSRHGELTAPFTRRTRRGQPDASSRSKSPSGARERVTATGAESSRYTARAGVLRVARP